MKELNKIELQQILDRLELTAKDRAKLAEYINQGEEAVKELNRILEGIPEDLDTFKEIANTPADFLNKNYELGGVVNMPFGYTNLNYNNKTQVFYDPTEDDEVVLGPFVGSGGLISSAENQGFVLSSAKQLVFNNILGKENSITVNGPIGVYSEQKQGEYYLHVYIIQGSYYPNYITFIPFTALSRLDIKKLPLEFTTPYIVGNDTQEHLDELYRRLDKRLPFVSNMILYHTPEHVYRGIGYFNPTYSNNYILDLICNTGVRKYQIRIGGINGQNLKDLLYLQDISEYLSIEESDLTPDWNANEGEAGYIENKTHGLTKELIVEKQYIGIGHTIEGNNIFRLSPFHLSQLLCFKFFEEDIDANTTTAFEYILRPNDYILQPSNIGEYNYDCGKIIFNDDDYTVTITLEAPPFIKIYLEIYYVTDLKQIDPVFIPDTVLKTTPQTLSGDTKNQVKENIGIIDPVTPDWNAQEGESGYIASKYFGISKERIYLEWNNNEAELNDRSWSFTHLIYPTITSNDEMFYNIAELKRVNDHITLNAANNTSGNGSVNIEWDNENYKYTFTLNGTQTALNYPWFVISQEKNPVPIPEPFIPNTIARVADYEALEARVAELEAKLSEITITVDE